MARVAGITIEKDIRGNARFARIDLRKYGELLNPFLKEVGVEFNNLKITSKLKRSIDEAKSGNYTAGNIENFW